MITYIPFRRPGRDWTELGQRHALISSIAFLVAIDPHAPIAAALLALAAVLPDLHRRDN